MALDYGNVQVALDWAAASSPQLEARIVGDLWWFWSFGGAVREARKRIDSVLAKDSVSGRALAWLNLMAAKWALTDGDRERGAAELDRAEETAREIADHQLMVLALNMRGVMEAPNDPASSELYLRRAIEVSHDLQPSDGYPAMGQALSMVLNNLSMTLLIADRPNESLVAVEDAIRVMMHEPEVANLDLDVLHTRGAVLLALHRIHDANDQFLASLRIANQNRNEAMAIPALIGLACAASASGAHACSVTLLTVARRWSRLLDLAPHLRLVTPYEEAERTSCLALGASAMKVAAQRGGTMDLNQALEFAEAAADAGPELPLAPRKLQVVSMVAEGLTNKEIARRLSISERTVDAHLEQVRRQLGLRNRAQVAAWAVSSALAQ
jgi:non-specific serine/threonine protein kinase